MKVNQQKNPSRVSSYLKENSLEGGVIHRDLRRPIQILVRPEEELEIGPNELDLPINTNVRIKPPPQNIIDELNKPIEEKITDLPPPIHRDLRRPRQILVGPDILDEPIEEKVNKKPFPSIFNFKPPLDNDTLLENIQKQIAEKGEKEGINFNEYKVFFKWYIPQEKSYYFIVIKYKINPYNVSEILKDSKSLLRTYPSYRQHIRDEIASVHRIGGVPTGIVTFNDKNGYLVKVDIYNRGYVHIDKNLKLPQSVFNQIQNRYPVE